MIHHLLYPKGASINDSIPPEFSTVKYASVDDAISIIQRQGKGCAMAYPAPFPFTRMPHNHGVLALSSARIGHMASGLINGNNKIFPYSSFIPLCWAYTCGQRN